ncbi:hypothetical protein GOB94_01475 [Granulicella sp. 5B5]|uniref:hypothetical protein n=1 Tax=Granulicella sp. 5B5 TaxID=1617967 RepID=UPI0015F5BF28|nr:hypothetical protein [Granulicella sp. 5B5]QMV17523.1 hypothetical protein GOB94_01475 [Granulicella sp. 5B5]
MAFRFPLTTVLRVRILREEHEERILQNILQEITRTRRSILKIKAELRSAWYSAPDFSGQTSGRELHLSERDAKQLEAYLKELEQQLEKLEQLKETQLLRYQTARQDRELLGEMCERHHAACSLAAAKREQRSIDDAFMARRIHR